jgi:2-oxoglutarate ferredoxin oxidoreductase subunit gamma
VEFLLSGSGGQGIILAATILAEAAVATGMNVVQTQSYGPEARGGASRAEVIVSDEEIDYPEVEAADVTLCLSQAAFDKYAPLAREGGFVVFDSGLVDAAVVSSARLVGARFTAAAEQAAGTALAANVVALGTLVELTSVVPDEALRASLEARLPARLVERNLRALDRGRELARETGSAP